MNLVTDTHALLWYMGASRKLSRNAKRAFEKAEAGIWTIHVPSAVLYEAVLLDERGRIRIAYDALVEQLELQEGFRVASFSSDDVTEARALRPLVDPFDRMIAGASRRLGYPLITNDERITKSRLVEVYW
jgi:PIN domain nuclease of toxin-antitoxin system